jgi:excisionase family DNA binding protein
MLENQVPQMVTIREAASRTGMSYDSIYKLCQKNEIVYVRCGAKYLINFDRFVDFLNHGSSEK